MAEKEKTFTEAWNDKYKDFVKSEKGVVRVMEHRNIDEDTEIYCVVMNDKTEKYQVRIYSKGKMKIHSKHEKSTEALESYRALRDEMKPEPKAKSAKKTAAKRPAKKAGKKASGKKASGKKASGKKASGKKEAVEPEDGFWD